MTLYGAWRIHIYYIVYIYIYVYRIRDWRPRLIPHAKWREGMFLSAISWTMNTQLRFNFADCRLRVCLTYTQTAILIIIRDYYCLREASIRNVQTQQQSTVIHMRSCSQSVNLTLNN